MLNAKTITAGGFAAEVSSATLTKSDSNSKYDLVTYTTVDPHNFFVGSQISIVNVDGAYAFTKAIDAVVPGARTVAGNSYLETGYVRYRVDLSAAQFFKVGDVVYIAGLVPTGYNGYYYIQNLETTASYCYISVINSTITTVTDAVGTVTILSGYLNPLVNANVYRVEGPKSFSVKLDRYFNSDANVTFTSTSGTAYATNGALSSVDILYAQPDL